MDQAFFHDPGLPEPKFNPDVSSGSHAGQTSRILTGIEHVLLVEQPDIVLVLGDTNTVLAGALVTAKLHILRTR
jgi:UDP-N-acetylglucosamine 2-epimerase (non-hydrolysing)